MRSISRRGALGVVAALASAGPGLAAAQVVQRAPSGLRIIGSDFAAARAAFHTRLLHSGPSPQSYEHERAPNGVEEVEFRSGELRLKGWLGRPAGVQGPAPAVVFAHGGFAFGAEDFDMARPYLAAGFVVLTPMVRGENGMPGAYSMFYGEVDDIAAAGAYLKALPYVDAARVYLAGHSVGGTLAMLAAQASTNFRASASFSGSPDQITFCEAWADIVPFDMRDSVELEMRSPLAYAASFKAPARLFYATREVYGPDMELTASIARAAGKDVVAQTVRGDHFTAVPEAMARSIAFFQAQS
ncbi:MAG: alpha/beta fold hydrolase [Pseudomonadota bacterium]